MNGECRLCGKVGIMERHHAFSGSYRRTADLYGCIVTLCPECHRYIHSSKGAEDKKQLQEQVQFETMERLGWTKMDWLSAFGKSWI